MQLDKLYNYKDLITISILTSLSIIISVVCNILAVKLIPTHIGKVSVEVSASSLLFIFILMISSETVNRYGQRIGNFVAIMTFVFTAVFVVTVSIFRAVPSTDSVIQQAYNLLFQNNGIFIIASVVAYIISVNCSIALSAYFPNTVTLVTIVSTALDAVVYTGIGYLFGCGWYRTSAGFVRWLHLLSTQYAIQVALIVIVSAALSTYKKLSE